MRAANGAGADEFDMRDRRDSLGAPAAASRRSAWRRRRASSPTPAAVSRRRAMCPTCGNAVPAEFTFCGQCGSQARRRRARRRHRADAHRGRTVGRRRRPRAARPHPPRRHRGRRASAQRGRERHRSRHRRALRRRQLPLAASRRHSCSTPPAACVRDDGSLNGVFMKLTRRGAHRSTATSSASARSSCASTSSPRRSRSTTASTSWARPPGLLGRHRAHHRPRPGRQRVPAPRAKASHLGRERGDVLFPEDGYVSGLHAAWSCATNGSSSTDLNSSNGTFIRVRGERVVKPGSAILMGQQLFRISY